MGDVLLKLSLVLLAKNGLDIYDIVNIHQKVSIVRKHEVHNVVCVSNEKQRLGTMLEQIDQNDF